MLHNAFLTVLRSDFYVAMRSVTTYFLLLGPAVLVAIRLSLEHFAEMSKQVQVLTLDANVDVVASFAYGFVVDGIQFGFVVTAFAYLTFSAWTFANDYATGVIRHGLIQRTSRTTYLCTKLTLLHAYVFVTLALVIFVAFTTGSLLWDLGPVVEDGYEIIGEAEIQREIVDGIVLAVLPFPALVTFGLCVSVWSKTPTRAIAVALVFAVAFDLMKGDFGTISTLVYQSYVPLIDDQSYLNSVSQLVRGYADVFVDEVTLSANRWVPIPQMIGFLVIGLLGIRRTSL